MSVRSQIHPVAARWAVEGKVVKLRVSRSAVSALHRGYPWLFAERVKAESRAGLPGDLAVVYDAGGRFVAAGLYDPCSAIRMRVLRWGLPGPIDGAFFAERIAKALARRAALPATGTDGYRMVHGESDGMPGFVADRYGDTAVVKLYTPAWLPHLRHCLGALLENHPFLRVVLRLSRSVKEHPEHLRGLCDGDLIAGDAPTAPVLFSENGLRFEVDPVRGQKTGFFLDQRDNRARVEKLSRGRRVLNVFSYSGGFSLAAARGGAREVVSVDLSGHALESARRNFALNAQNPEVAAARHRTLEGDAFAVMADQARRGERYDLIVIDPPAFAVRRAHVDEALGAYGRLAHLGVTLLEPGGDIVLASCSAPVTPEKFRHAVCAAAARAGRPLREIRETDHALDHPLDFAESRYLKCLFAKA